MLNYEWINKEAHEELTMLFLHEALGSIGQWKDFPSRICLELNLPGLIYERKGHGRSPALGKKRTSRYLHEYALDELPHFLTEIERKFGSRKWILIGHSDGGSIALLYAAQFPEKIHSIVTMAAHVVNEPETIAGIQPAVDAFKQGKLDGLRKYHGERTSDLFYAWADTWKSEFFANWNICNDIRSIQAPVLAIQGDRDQYGTEKQLRFIKEACQAKTVILEDCGHHPHLEQEDECIELITNFVTNSQS